MTKPGPGADPSTLSQKPDFAPPGQDPGRRAYLERLAQICKYDAGNARAMAAAGLTDDGRQDYLDAAALIDSGELQEQAEILKDVETMKESLERDQIDPASLATAQVAHPQARCLFEEDPPPDDPIWQTEIARIASGIEGVEAIITLAHFKEAMAAKDHLVTIAGIDLAGQPLVEIEQPPSTEPPEEE